MLTPNHLLQDIQASPSGLSLAELLLLHPELSRRTAQRWLKQFIIDEQLVAEGQGRARRYLIPNLQTEKNLDLFPSNIPLSSDSLDILAYIDQPLNYRKPIGYQIDFLDSYQPNQTYYLPEPLRIQLKKMGDTGKETLPAGTYGRTILGRLLIDLSWASSHLEGNTYSRLDTQELIEEGKIAKGKARMETQMILNHKTAIELLVSNVEVVGFNRYTFLNLHSALSENLLPNPADEGRLRRHTVNIGKSIFHPLSFPQQIETMFDLMLLKAGQIHDPFEQAFFIMVQLPYLQPFADVNKRTSRLAANLPLLQHNLCPLTFLGISEQAYSRAILGVYELTRIELLRDLFIWAYERSTQEYLAIKQDLAEPDPLRLQYREFIKKIIHKVVKNPKQDALLLIEKFVETTIDPIDQINVRALIIEELRRLHEGVLARYNLRVSEYERWRKKK